MVRIILGAVNKGTSMDLEQQGQPYQLYILEKLSIGLILVHSHTKPIKAKVVELHNFLRVVGKMGYGKT